MGRSLATVLLISMASQSSGAALASGGAPWQANLTSLRLYALLTGGGDRYAAMHAAQPAITLPKPALDAARLMSTHRALRPRIRRGVRQAATMPARSALDPRHHLADPLALRRSIMAPATGSASGTGVEHWWTYEERAIPGIGKAMVNVGTGNWLVSALDVDVPEQGIDLAFQRVYNSQSLHDYNGDDGGNPAIFGNRWTNNYDANIVYNSTANTITVYDLDGAACTYTSDGHGNWLPCAGIYATLAPTDATDCTYAWTKPNGTVYWFHTYGSGNGSCSGLTQAKQGHLQEILARNQNNYITFGYSYVAGQPPTSENVTRIDVNHSDGDTLTMRFGTIPGTSINELASITRPDNATLQYLYDTSGNLIEVDKPGNNAAFTLPSPPPGHGAVTSGNVPESYA
ncbi:MAG TPA: DUF6531 domain-containing protein, partial [Candidatus Binatia bacterium]|nr:DUF6531 domain-containing protein [Candidatus Binatia bacterium]